LGGAACSGEAWAVDAGSRSEPVQSLSDPAPVLRLSPQLGEPRKAGRPKPARDAWRPAAVEAPLSLSLTILLKPEEPLRATAPMVRSVAPASGDLVAAGRAAPAGRSRGGDSGSALVEPEAPVPFDPTPAVAGARRAPAAAERPAGRMATPTDSGLPDLSGETWVMAPIRWAGTTGTTGNFFTSADGENSWSIGNTLNMQANSFIGAPYIAQWSGLFGMNSTKAHFTQGTGETLKSDSSGTDIGGSVNVFPVSRFPFSATFNHSTSEVKFGQNRAPVNNTAYGLRQQYRTEGGDAYSASYNSNHYETGRNTSQNSVLTGSVSARRVVNDPDHYLEGDHNLNASVAFVPNDRDVGGQTQRLLNANASHTWMVHEDLSLSNFLTLASAQQDQFSGDTLSSFDSRVLLAATNFTWRPVEDLPLTLNGGGSFSQTQQTQANETLTQQTLAANLSTSYRFSNNLSASGNASVASTSLDTSSYTSAGAGVNASYASDPLKFGDYIYNWNLGGGVSGNFSSEGDSFLGLNTSVGHNLTRTLVIDQAQAVNLNAGQTLSFNQTQEGPGTSLSHNLGAAWRAAYGQALNVSLNANLSDTISTGQSNDNHYTNMTLMGTGQYQVSSRSALSLNVNMNWSRTFDGASSQQEQAVNGFISNGNQSQWTGSFSLGYTHSSPFSVPNLNYNANLQWINSQSNLRLARADAVGSQVQESVTFQQFLDYRIGRLMFRLQHAMIDQAGRKSASVFGSVNREFDGFFDGRW
jgi:hypothetical protein